MFLKATLLLLLALAVKQASFSQCSTLGQTPSSAFPVCGNTSFVQHNVPICTNGIVPAQGCGAYTDANPFYYAFSCYKTGTFDLLITPDDLKDDYDWQIFDMTNAVKPEDIYKNSALFVTANWSGTYGKTGTAPGNGEIIVCGSEPGKSNPFSLPPVLQAGHNYMLLISHFTRTQSGYSLSFSGGTAIITDTTQPRLKSAVSNCGGTKIGVLLKRKVKCSSLAGNGSDFFISSPAQKIISAISDDCYRGFDLDSLVLTLSGPLAPGTYKLYSKKGNDNNTLLDDCDNPLPVNDSVEFIVDAVPPTPMDSISPVVPCAPRSLDLVFKKKINCGSVAQDGSDFVITGPQAVTVNRAVVADCGLGDGNIARVYFSGPILTGGDYQIKLVRGSDGNTVIDECTQETPPGAVLGFSTNTTASAAFNMQVKLGCRQDTVILTHADNNAIESWKWMFDDGVTYNTQNGTRVYSSYGAKHVTLQVTSGVCIDTARQDFVLDNELRSLFFVPAFICPGEPYNFTDSSIGKITGWDWFVGNGFGSRQQTPSFIFPGATGDRSYPVRLVVQNNFPCYDTSYKTIKVRYSCYITVPTAFTPNGDGVNDYLYPLNGFKAANLHFKVYNRWGQLVFETADWQRKWDGTINGNVQATGVYVWMLSYTNIDTGVKNTLKGTTLLVR